MEFVALPATSPRVKGDDDITSINTINEAGRDDDRIPRLGCIWYCEADEETRMYSPRRGSKIPRTPCGFPNSEWTVKHARRKGEPRWEPHCENCGRKRQLRPTKLHSDRNCDISGIYFSCRKALIRRVRQLQEIWRRETQGNLNIEDNDEDWEGF